MTEDKSTSTIPGVMQGEHTSLTVERLAETMDEFAKKFPKPKFGITVKEMIEELQKHDPENCVVIMGSNLWTVRPDIIGLSPIKPIIHQPSWMKDLDPKVGK